MFLKAVCQVQGAWKSRIPDSERHNFWRQKAFLGNPGLQKSLLTVTVAGVVIVVLLSGALECTRTQWDKLKILWMFGGDVFLWNVSKQLVISCARLHWKGVYQRAHGWAIIGELQLQRKMVQSNDSLRFNLANYNCFRCKVDSNVVFRCCHIFYPSH